MYTQLRMGKGKGGFDHWAARMAPSQIAFELKGMIHEKVARDVFRVAGNKLPGESPPPSRLQDLYRSKIVVF